MINFHTLRYKNLMSSGNAWIEIKLDNSPSTLILGKNGAGKSTMLEALTFCLFGRPFRNITKKQLINTINGKQCLVECTFSIGSKSYLVRRGIKPDVFDIICDGSEMKKIGDARNHQEMLQQIMGWDYKAFSQVVVLSASNFRPFMQLDAADRRAVIEDILDIKVYGEMAKGVRARVSSVKESLSAIDMTISGLRQRVDVQQQYIQTLKEDVQRQRQETQNSIDATSAVISGLESTIESLQNELSSLAPMLADMQPTQQRLQRLNNMKSAILSKQREVRGDMAFWVDNDTCPTCQQDIDQNIKTSAIDKANNKIADLDDGLSKFSDEFDALTRKMAEFEELAEKRRKVQAKQVEVSNQLVVELRMRERLITSLNGMTTQSGDIKAEEAKLRTALADLDDATHKRAEIIREKDSIELCSAILKDGGFKSRVVEQYLPIMNSLIQQYLSIGGLWVSFVLDKDFNETIQSRHRDTFTYYSFSEGEKQRIDLSILFAWRAIAKMKNSVSCNILFFDEILDRCLDTEGVDAAMSLIYTLTGTHVFVISHKAEHLMDRFNSIISFSKENNFTILERQEDTHNASSQ